jgi:hypothetical protein
MIRRNHLGYRVGEDHQRAQLRDWAVARVRELRERDPTLWTLTALSELFDTPLSTIRDICSYATRPPVR